MRTTEFAPAIAPVKEQTADAPAPASGYDPPTTATSWKAGRFSGKDFALQPDGTLCCPAGKTLHPTEQRTEHDGSLRVLYAARIGDCRVCPLREQCQWHGERRQSRVGSVCCCIRSRWALRPCSGGIGAAESRGGPVYTCYAANGWTSRWSRPCRLQSHRRPSSLVHSGHITVSLLPSGWRAMPAPPLLAGSRSSSSACLMPSPISSACQPSCSTF